MALLTASREWDHSTDVTTVMKPDKINLSMYPSYSGKWLPPRVCAMLSRGGSSLQCTILKHKFTPTLRMLHRYVLPKP